MRGEERGVRKSGPFKYGYLLIRTLNIMSHLSRVFKTANSGFGFLMGTDVLMSTCIFLQPNELR